MAAILQAVQRCSVAGGERVPPSPLGWYSIVMTIHYVMVTNYYVFCDDKLILYVRMTSHCVVYVVMTSYFISGYEKLFHMW